MNSSDSLKEFPSVAVVSVTQNRCEPLLKLLFQVKDLDYPDGLIGVFIVDSASTDDTVEKIRQNFPEVHLTVIDKNLGIAAGFNAGIKEVLNAERDFKYIWLLDSDAEVEKETLMPLVEMSEKAPDIAVAGSAIYDPVQRDDLISAGLYISWEQANVYYNKPPQHEIENSFNVELIPACSALTRADLFRKLGLWDERFWLYWGDTEWCMRALRNGYRVCCAGKSRVWHRNWALVKPDFYFPYILHDRIRSALLFNLIYNPEKSISGIRNLIIKSYVKAAFENFTLRPNYTRANDEGVQDFLKWFFLKKDFSSWPDVSKLDEIDEMCRSLKGKVPGNPRVILNQIDDSLQREEIKKVFQKHFNRIKWEEIPVKRSNKEADLLSDYSEYVFHHFPRLLFYLLTFFRKRDIIISPVYVPHMYNLAAARYTMLFNTSLRGCVREGRIFSGFINFFKLLMKGLRVSLLDLPRALKRSDIPKSIA